MKIIYLISSILFLLNSVRAQNNDIFRGGNYDGATMSCFDANGNNSIFSGGNNDGFSQGCFFQQNHIFGGGTGDGVAMGCFLQHNPIFSGGIGDGFAQNNFLPQQCSAVEVKVFLQGPFNGANMNTILINSPGFPLQEPYSTLGHSLQNAGFTTTLSLLNTHKIVDWVLVQLRSSETEIVATRAALLRLDGIIVEIDGDPTIRFVDIPQQAYHIAVLHRNHLGVMTAMPTFIAAN